MNHLTFEDVSDIHDHLEEFFRHANDPISPPGIKDENMLKSAVDRQHVGFAGELKHNDPVSNACTLCYGVCSNHAFYNGNKRAALVALLCHLDANGLSFDATTNQDLLYSWMKKVAAHKIVRGRRRRDMSDAEVLEMSRWVGKRTRKVKRGERVITFRELRKVLRVHGYELNNKKKNYIDVIGRRTRTEKTGLFKKKEIEEEFRVCHMVYHGEGTEVGKAALKTLRQKCGLTEEDGCDSEMFYSSQRPIDAFIAQFQKTLRRLART